MTTSTRFQSSPDHGVSPKTVFEIETRPFHATNDGKGVAVREILPDTVCVAVREARGTVLRVRGAARRVRAVTRARLSGSAR
jgi:hypothetical protein